MAEGFIRHFYNDRYDASSGGTEPSGINPYAVKVMEEVGIDISSNKSKSVKQFLDEKFDYVVTVCDQANEACPFFPRAKYIMHRGFQDPSLAKGPEEEIMEVFRRVRDEIKKWSRKHSEAKPETVQILFNINTFFRFIHFSGIGLEILCMYKSLKRREMLCYNSPFRMDYPV